MGFGRQPLFSGTIANGVTQYVGVPINGDKIGLQVAWKDATSSATITLEVTNYPATDAPVASAGSAWHWKDTGVSITGPAASAAGSVLVNSENVNQQRARLKIVAAADCVIDVLDGAAAL